VPAALAGTEFVAKIKGLEQSMANDNALGLTLVDRRLFLDRSNA
jgi:hypothetical protein